MSDGRPLDAGFAGFACGELRLALPMAAVREVLPFKAVIALPSTEPAIPGGIDLRGVTLPVLDLGQVLRGRPVVSPHACVVVMVHDGRLLGLLTDRVTGIFALETGSMKRMDRGDASDGVFAASLRRADDGSLASLLSPAALFGLPGVPLLEDPEPERQQHAADAVRGDDAADQVAELPQMLLLTVGGMPMAIPAMDVYATLSQPTLAPSALAGGACRGVVAFGNETIPAVELLEVCGLGQRPAAAPSEAFLLKFDQGLVCMLVDRVLDVVQLASPDARTIPAFALPQPELFAGLLPRSALPARALERGHLEARQYLLLDGGALKGSPRLRGLAAANAGTLAVGSIGSGVVALTAGARTGRSLLTYEIVGEVATPIEQIVEVLPYPDDALVLAEGGPLLSLLAWRGRSIPVLCLARLLGLPAQATGKRSTVLLVEADGMLVGLAVARLCGIESADWEAALPGRGPQRAAGREPEVLSVQRDLAHIRSGETERMLRVLDLRALVSSLKAGPSLLVSPAPTPQRAA